MMHIQSLLLCLILLATTEVAVTQSLPGCPNKCGDVDIPYPFGVGLQSGTGKNCFLEEETFSVSCDENSKLWHRNVEISSISLKGHMDMSMLVSRVCYDGLGRILVTNAAFLTTPAFTISSKENKFTSVGCDTYGYILGSQNNRSYATGCLTKCDSDVPNEENSESCSGVGCCQVDIPQGMRNISIQAYSFEDQPKSTYNNCSYAFVAKQGWFNFSTDHLKHFPFDKALLVVDWAVSNDSCHNAITSSNYACTSNTDCEDSVYGYGYRCICKFGFEGNPYHPDGCHDIDECMESTHDCISKDNCFNTIGSYECYCPRGYSGNGKKEGGCQAPLWHNPLTKVLVGASVGSVVLFVVISWMYLVCQRRKLIKSKDKFFRQNGGYFLQQQLSGKQSSSLTAKIFTAQELKKATDNYHDSLIIGRGGFGTVYKGFLPDNKIVAIKKSKLVDQSQIEQFINEVIVLSQINHRNVVKLLGCCLETEIPLLVYEFVNNGTLFDYIHNKSKSASDHISWETRLRIASEVAGALSYLHSAACIPIIHRDVKTSNILLDETCTPKVSDFGASRLVPLDQTELATMVQGTFGYLDPQYMQTNQLTEKSDVYSFGVVLVELLTGKKALTFDGPEEERSLAMHFLSCLTQGRLFQVVDVGIVNEENKQRINEVAVLAARCLRLKGEERPSMKEVAMELEGIRMIGKHPWRVKKDLNLEESQTLILRQTFDFSECVDHSIGLRNTGWHSMLDHVLIDFDDGR